MKLIRTFEGECSLEYVQKVSKRPPTLFHLPAPLPRAVTRSITVPGSACGDETSAATGDVVGSSGKATFLLLKTMDMPRGAKRYIQSNGVPSMKYTRNYRERAM